MVAITVSGPWKQSAGPSLKQLSETHILKNTVEKKKTKQKKQGLYGGLKPEHKKTTSMTTAVDSRKIGSDPEGDSQTTDTHQQIIYEYFHYSMFLLAAVV